MKFRLLDSDRRVGNDSISRFDHEVDVPTREVLELHQDRGIEGCFSQEVPNFRPVLLRHLGKEGASGNRGRQQGASSRSGCCYAACRAVAARITSVALTCARSAVRFNVLLARGDVVEHIRPRDP